MDKKDLTINELREAKKKAERQMIMAITPIYNEFKEDTGISPNSISVNLVCVSSIGEPYTYELTNVSMDVEL